MVLLQLLLPVLDKEIGDGNSWVNESELNEILARLPVKADGSELDESLELSDRHPGDREETPDVTDRIDEVDEDGEEDLETDVTA